MSCANEKIKLLNWGSYLYFALYLNLVIFHWYFSELNNVYWLYLKTYFCIIISSIFTSSSSSSPPSPLPFLFSSSASSYPFLLWNFPPSPSRLSYLMISLRSRVIITQLSCHVGSPGDLLEMCVAIVLVKNWIHPLQWWLWIRGTSCDVWRMLSHSELNEICIIYKYSSLCNVQRKVNHTCSPDVSILELWWDLFASCSLR